MIFSISDIAEAAQLAPKIQQAIQAARHNRTSTNLIANAPPALPKPKPKAPAPWLQTMPGNAQPRASAKKKRGKKQPQAVASKPPAKPKKQKPRDNKTLTVHMMHPQTAACDNQHSIPEDINWKNMAFDLHPRANSATRTLAINYKTARTSAVRLTLDCPGIKGVLLVGVLSPAEVPLHYNTGPATGGFEHHTVVKLRALGRLKEVRYSESLDLPLPRASRVWDMQGQWEDPREKLRPSVLYVFHLIPPRSSNVLWTLQKDGTYAPQADLSVTTNRGLNPVLHVKVQPLGQPVTTIPQPYKPASSGHNGLQGDETGAVPLIAKLTCQVEQLKLELEQVKLDQRDQNRTPNETTL